MSVIDWICIAFALTTIGIVIYFAWTERRFAQNQARYDSHFWKAERQMTDYGTGFEYIVICNECGAENIGDPSQFPEVQYPVCQLSKLRGLINGQANSYGDEARLRHQGSERIPGATAKD